jgi:hypothetical protein
VNCVAVAQYSDQRFAVVGWILEYCILVTKRDVLTELSGCEFDKKYLLRAVSYL